MKKVLLMSLMSLGLVACGKSDEPFNAQMRGEILTLSQTGNISGIYVEGEESEEFDITAASITINKETELLDENGKSIKFEKLNEGNVVEVEFVGDLAESYPVQATAKTIRIVAQKATEEKTEESDEKTLTESDATSSEEQKEETSTENNSTETSTENKKEDSDSTSEVNENTESTTEQ